MQFKYESISYNYHVHLVCGMKQICNTSIDVCNKDVHYHASHICITSYLQSYLLHNAYIVNIIQQMYIICTTKVHTCKYMFFCNGSGSGNYSEQAQFKLSYNIHLYGEILAPLP